MQVASVVKNIAVYAQEAQPIITEVLALVTSFGSEQSGEGSNVSAIQAAGNKIQTDLSDLETLCNAYTAKPSVSVWQQITALVDDLVTNGDSALTQLIGIKSPSGQEAAITTLASLDALLHTIDGFVQTTQSSPQVKATAAKRAIKIQAISQFWSERDKAGLAQAFGQDYSTLYSHEIAMGF
jgi:hypothetical protein